MPQDVDAATAAEVGFEPDTLPEGAVDVEDDGKVACPECGGRYKPGGIKRHITVAHGGTGMDVPGDDKPPAGRRGSIAEKGAQFQRSASFLVSMACSRCGTVLYEDAKDDWSAIDDFCQGKPQLRKQVLAFLNSADFILLVGALGTTTRKMIGHHSIGQRLSFGAVPMGPISENGSEAEHSTHDPLVEMAKFMQGLPEDELNTILQTAISQMAGGPIAPMGTG